MNTRMLKTLMTIFCISQFLLSCGKKSFKELVLAPEVQAIPGLVNADLCTLDPNLVNQQVKIMFVLDISGSNGASAGGRPATDPTRERRYGSLTDWLGARTPNPAEYYTLLEFSGDSTISAPGLQNYDPLYAPFTNELPKFTDVVNEQRGSTTDINATPYKSALNTVINTIRGDAVKAKERAEKGEPATQSTYIIIFLSDGVPTDSQKPEIISIIENDLMELPKNAEYGGFINQITLNTGYYYIDVDVPEARDLLVEMAKVGKGEAYSFDTGKIDFDKLTDVMIKKVSTSLSDLIVNNLNMVWDMEVAQLLPDTDADFISDRMEKLLGSDPNKADSDNNGVRDGIEMILDSKSRPCRDEKCDPKRATAFTGCYKPGTTELLDTDGDGIYDCEELALKTDKDKVDTNGDDLPDYLSLKFSIPATKTANGTDAPPAVTVDSDFDEINNLKEVKLNTPPRLDNNSIKNLKPQQYKISQLSYSSKTGVACYNLEVKDIAFATPTDMLRMYFMENETTQTGRRFFRILDRKAKNYNLELFKDDFTKLLPKQ